MMPTSVLKRPMAVGTARSRIIYFRIISLYLRRCYSEPIVEKKKKKKKKKFLS